MKKYVILLGAMIAVGFSAQSQVSLDSCRRMALSNNRSLQVADQVIRGASYERKAAKAAYLPGIDFTGGYMYNQNIINLLGEDAKLPTMSFNPTTMKYDYNLVKGPDGFPIKDPTSGQYIPSEVAVIPKEAMSYDIHNVVAGAFTLTQPVFMGGQIRAMNDITKYAEQLAVSSRNAAAQEVVFSVDEAYWTVVSLKAKQKLADSFVNLVDTLHGNVESMLKEGVATRSDLLTVEVKLNEARIAATKVGNGLSLSRMALAQLCGMPIDSSFRLADEDNDIAIADVMQPTYTMDEVYSRRSDLDMLRKGINIMESKEKLTLGSMLPKVAIVGMYSFSNPNVIDGFKKRFGGGFSVGATLTVPLWHWGGNYNRYRAAKANTQAQRLLLQDAEEKVSLQVSQAQYSYQEAKKTYEMTLTNLDVANENLRNAELGFYEGVLTMTDVLTAQTGWLKANSENIDARINLQLTNVYLSKVLGTLAY